MNKLIFPLVIFIYFVLVTILIINIHERNTIIKRACVLFFAFVFVAIAFYDTIVVDKLIYYILVYIYYPSYYVYVFTVLFMILVFIYSVFNTSLSNNVRVFNYAFCSISLVSYIFILLLKIDISVYKNLYTGTSLICLRAVTRGFLIWSFCVLMYKYYNSFMRKE